MAYYFFQWNDEIIEHLAEHDVTPDDFEAIVQFPDGKGKSRSSGNPIAFGLTDDGRKVACVYRMIDEITVEPVTAYEV
jgi:hypothetical protein